MRKDGPHARSGLVVWPLPVSVLVHLVAIFSLVSAHHPVPRPPPLQIDLVAISPVPEPVPASRPLPPPPEVKHMEPPPPAVIKPQPVRREIPRPVKTRANPVRQAPPQLLANSDAIAETVTATSEMTPVQEMAQPPSEPERAQPQSRLPPPSYKAIVQSRLQSVMRYPERARMRHREGTAILLFTLNRHGEVLSWKIAQSSGCEMLDEEAGRMVQRANPFPPFPKSIAANLLEFQIPVEFSLKSG